MTDLFPPATQRPKLLAFAEACCTRADKLRRDECGDWAIFGKLAGFSCLHGWHDQGRRRDYADIPKAVTDLVDDPFRSLAGELRLAGGYAKDTTPFSEFLWADFVRRRMKRQCPKRISTRLWKRPCNWRKGRTPIIFRAGVDPSPTIDSLADSYQRRRDIVTIRRAAVIHANALQPEFRILWKTSIFQRMAYYSSFSSASLGDWTCKSVTGFQSMLFLFFGVPRSEESNSEPRSVS
jgi:Putative ParB-like nuclease